MKIISYIGKKQSYVPEKTLRRCELWKDKPPVASPIKIALSDQPLDGLSLDYEFFANLAG